MKFSFLQKAKFLLLVIAVAFFASACSKEQAPALTLTPEQVMFDPAVPDGNTFTISTPGAWKVVTTDMLVSFNPTAGYGDGVVTITSAPKGKTSTLTVIAGEGHNLVAKTIQVLFLEKPYRWPELPAEAVSEGDFVVGTNWTTTVTSHQRVRNYTFCYDTRRHCPLWVAHPQHACYMEGTTPRTDPWKIDPALSAEQSAIMYPYPNFSGARALFSRADENPTLATNWTTTLGSSEGIQWTRGHLLQSACRPGGGEEINAQTCFSSNISPQKGKAFDKLWAAAEENIKDNQICSDTLFYVSGAYFENENVKAKDGYNSTTKSYLENISKYCIVPTHYYKVLLRTKSGNSGKRIQDCAPGELKAVAFWFTHADVDPVSGSASPALSKAYMLSVAELQQKTGIEFFPEAPEAVRESYDAADWGF